MKTRILLVDDEPDLLEILTSFLDAEGYEVFHARNAEEFSSQALSMKPHVIILDIVLGDANGPDIYGELLRKGLSAHIPVIFLSALVPPNYLADAAGGRRYTMHAKPFQPEKLMRDIRRLTQNPNLEAA